MNKKRQLVGFGLLILGLIIIYLANLISIELLSGILLCIALLVSIIIGISGGWQRGIKFFLRRLLEL